MSLSVNDLSFTYNSGLPTEAKALQNISFSAEKGEILSIVGHTGSGKSTLAMHLNGLLIPQSGEVVIDGIKTDSDPKNLRKIRQSVGLVFQYPEQQI
ncbi:MAG: ATP-binding cassette domain-containing protein, partial [Synergistaceae bacterium]|nr:ATP-binding cassette domain-containing protein [Synergistaceae bacterium]